MCDGQQEYTHPKTVGLYLATKVRDGPGKDGEGRKHVSEREGNCLIEMFVDSQLKSAVCCELALTEKKRIIDTTPYMIFYPNELFLLSPVHFFLLHLSLIVKSFRLVSRMKINIDVAKVLW